MSVPSPTPRPAERRYTSTEVAHVEAMVRAVDPLLLEAADDQDMALIRWHLSLDPMVRLRSAWAMAKTLDRFRPTGR